MSAVNRYFERQGRGNIATNTLLVVGWKIAGTSGSGWQWIAFCLLVATCGALMLLLDRMTAGYSLGLPVAVLLAVSQAGASSAMRITGEAPATLLLLGALGIVWSGQRKVLGRIWLVLLPICLALVLFKEALVVWLPALALLVMLKAGSERWAQVTSAGLILLAIGCVSRALVLVESAPPSAYARGFDGTVPSAWDTLFILWYLLWPLVKHGVSARAPDFMAWGCLLGMALARWKAGSRRRATLAALASPYALTAGLYAAWGRFEAFYALPCIAITLAYVGLLLQGKRQPVQTVVIGALFLFLIVSGIVQARHTAKFTFLRRAAEAQAVAKLAPLPVTDTIFVVTKTVPVQDWQSAAATMGRYLQMIHGLTGPVLVSESCQDFVNRDSTAPRSELALVYERECGIVDKALWRVGSFDSTPKFSLAFVRR
jgi:hypothetical protein